VTGPKIRFDVEANATGQAEVQGLANELERLGAELRKLGQQQAAITAFGELKTRTEATRAELEQAQAAAQKFGREIAASGTPTRAQAGQMEKLRDAVRSAKTAVQEQTAALDQSRRGLTALGLSSTNLAAQQRIVRDSMASTAAQARVVVQAYQQQGAAAQASAAQQVRAQATVRASVSQLGQQLQGLQNIAALGIGGGVLGSLTADVARVADQYSNLGARIRLVTGEGAAFEAGLDGVFNVAKRTSSALEETATLFTRISTAGRELGLSQADALALTESINQAIQLSGGSAQSASAAITQLVQGLQSGVLRGEEFNSVMEQNPRLARALADGLGVPIGELRKLAEQGALTSQVVISALQGQQAALEREFGKLPQTVGRAIQNLSTEWTRYIGQADQAGGASARTAEVINLLADNLQEVANALLLAGQAAAAYKAADLAAVVLRQVAASRAAAVAQAAETTARAAGTAATVANTAALGANTAGKAANAAAATALGAAEARAAAAGAAGNAGLLSKVGLLGRVAGGLGLAGVAVVAFGDLVVSAFRSAGTAIGEGAARLAGYRDRSAELEETERQLAESTRQAAAAAAEQAAAAQKAADATFGLSKEAKALVGEFDQLVLKGESVSAALDKVAGSFQLDSISGIQAAGAALDSLARRGVIAGEQIATALAKGLQGQDLAVFETRARAAFDSARASATLLQVSLGKIVAPEAIRQAEQDARRLQGALAAIDAEALRRVGSSVQELAEGVSQAFTQAINDVDAVAAALARAGASAEAAQPLLRKALDKALEAATTEKAVQAVIDRLKLLGSQGKISGDQLAAGLGVAQGKLDELRTGVNSVAEAMKRFGLTSREELQRTAEDSRAAWLLIRNNATLSLAQKQQAFKRYADDAIAANGGVVSSQLAVEARLLGVELQVQKTGSAFGSAFGDAEDAVARTRDRVSELRVELNDMGEVINSSAAGIVDSRTGLGSTSGGPSGSGSSSGSGGGGLAAGQGVKSQKISDSYDPITKVREGGTFQLPVPTRPGQWTFVPDQRVRGGASVAQAMLGQYITGSFLGQPGLPVQGVGIWVRTDEQPRETTAGTPFGGPAGAPPAAPGGLGTGSGTGSGSGGGVGDTSSSPTTKVVRIDLSAYGATASELVSEQFASDLIAVLERARRGAGG
jgi:tape measure domain-containing protein